MGRWSAVVVLAVAAAAAGGDLPALQVTVDAEVYAVLTEQIEIRPGLSTSGYPEVLTLARLSLDSAPRGAEVTLDGVAQGRTPLEIADLALGAHDLVVRNSGHATFHRNLRLVAPR